MLTDAERTQLQADVEATFPDVGTITRPGTGEGPFDPETGDYTPPAPTTIYEAIACRMAPWRGTDRVVEVGEQPVSLRYYKITTSVAITGVNVNDRFTFIQSADPDLEGLELRIRDVQVNSLGVQRRLICEHVLG